MTKFDLGVIILTGIGIIGLIVLSALDKSISVLLPLVTTLVGFVVGTNRKEIVASIGSMLKR